MNTRSCSFAGLIAFLACGRLLAQEPSAQRLEQATNHLKQVAAEMSARCLQDVSSLSDWKDKRPEMRRKLLDMLGLDPLPRRTPLHARTTGQLDRENFRIEKIVFQSQPGLYVTANFYVPKLAVQPLPTILYLCGHSPHPLGAKFHYQDRANWFASHGFACLILDTHEFGEISGIHHGTHDLNMWHWISLGYTPAGVEVWNALRALDYLETRAEVDPARIGLTGISGGGAMTWYTAAVDERIAAAAPVCSTFTFGSQMEHWVARGQCDCIYYHNSFREDFPIVGALIAPRPLLILSGQKDWIFPPDGYHAVFEKSKKIYDLYAGSGQTSDRIREVDDNVEHSDAPLFLREARQWMQRWLKNDSTPLPEEAKGSAKETAEDLASLPSVPRDATNYRIQNEFTIHASLKRPMSKSAWEKRRTELIAQLRERVFGWFPADAPPFQTETSKSGGGWHVRYGYADFKEHTFLTEADVRVRAGLLTPKNRATGAPLLIYVKRATDSFNSSDVDDLLPLMGSHSILLLNPRFTEHSLPPAEYANVERSAGWVGRTIASMQIWDALRAVDWLLNDQKLAPASVTLYGKGEMGIVALYAGLLDQRVNRLILNDPPRSHWQGPAILNVLRITDIPEVAAAFAPRRLVSLSKLPEPFELARGIYRMQGAANELLYAPSLPEALELGNDSSFNRRKRSEIEDRAIR